MRPGSRLFGSFTLWVLVCFATGCATISLQGASGSARHTKPLCVDATTHVCLKRDKLRQTLTKARLALAALNARIQRCQIDRKADVASEKARGDKQAALLTADLVQCRKETVALRKAKTPRARKPSALPWVLVGVLAVVAAAAGLYIVVDKATPGGG